MFPLISPKRQQTRIASSGDAAADADPAAEADADAAADAPVSHNADTDAGAAADEFRLAKASFEK